MRNCIIITFLVAIVYNLELSADNPCPPPCCGGGGQDRVSVSILEEGPREPSGGHVRVLFETFETWADGCEEPIIVLTERDGCFGNIPRHKAFGHAYGVKN